MKKFIEGKASFFSAAINLLRLIKLNYCVFIALIENNNEQRDKKFNKNFFLLQSQSRIPARVESSKIPTFGKPSKIARKLPTFRVPEIPVISRSVSGADLRRTNLVTTASSSVDCFASTTTTDELLVNETIDLVKCSSESLDLPVNETFNTAAVDTTFSKPSNDVTFLKPSNLPLQASNETVTIELSPMSPQQHDKTFDCKRPSRLSVDLAEQMNGEEIALNSTMKAEKLVDISAPHPPMDVVDDEKSPNVTQLLCDSLGNKTLVPEEIADDLSDDNVVEEDEMPPVVLKSQEGRIQLPPKQRFSFGLDLTEYTLDCSIELCDVSNSSSMQQNKSNNTKQSSFDESLGILTPDQMKEFLDSTRTSNGSHLQLHLHSNGHKGVGHHQCRVDLTPSPEELPLDPIEVKTDGGHIVFGTEPSGNLSPIPKVHFLNLIQFIAHP